MDEINEQQNEEQLTSKVPPQLTPFKKGKPKTGGMKKGWKSTKSIIRETLQRISYSEDKIEISELQAIIDKQIDIAKKEGKLENVTFLLEQAGDYIRPNQSPGADSNNFFNIESFKQIINKTDFLEFDEDEVIKEEAIIIEDESNIE